MCDSGQGGGNLARFNGTLKLAVLRVQLACEPIPALSLQCSRSPRFELQARQRGILSASVVDKVLRVFVGRPHPRSFSAATLLGDLSLETCLPSALQGGPILEPWNQRAIEAIPPELRERAVVGIPACVTKVGFHCLLLSERACRNSPSRTVCLTLVGRSKTACRIPDHTSARPTRNFGSTSPL